MGSNFNISWTSSPLKSTDFDKRSYRVEILDSNNNVVNKINTTALTASTKIDSAGKYNIRVRAINTKYPGDNISSVSASKTIVVTKPVTTLTSAMVSSIPDQEYNGRAIKPSVTVKYGSTVLKNGTDYDVTYSNNVNAGEATVIIKGKGSYSGTVKIKFRIVKKIYSVTLESLINGTASLSKTSACAGEKITVTATPASGYVLETITVNGNTIEGNKFTMPFKNAKVEVVFAMITNKVTDKETITPEMGAAELGEVATVNGLEYTVTTPFIDGRGTVALSGVKMPMEAVVIPETVEIKEATYTVNRISAKAFYGNKTVKFVNIGKAVVNIDTNAFYSCSNLISVSGGDSLKTIATSAFARCPKLTSFVITSNVLNKIGPTCFYKDSKLNVLYIKNTTKLTKSGVKKSLKGSSVKTIKVKKSKVSAYKKYFMKSVSGKSVKIKK